MTYGIDIRIDSDPATAQRLVLAALTDEGFDVSPDGDGFAARRDAAGAPAPGPDAAAAPAGFGIRFERAGERIIAQLRRHVMAAVGAGFAAVPFQDAFDDAAAAIADVLMQAGAYAGSDVI